MGIKQAKISISDALAEYTALRQQEKTIKDRKDYLAKILKTDAEKNGAKDSNGSFYATLGDFQYGSQARKSVSFNEELAKKFFREKGFTDCIKTVEVIDTDAVERYVSTGDITPHDIESVSTVKITYAIDVKRKEEVVVQETTLKEAKRK